VLSLQLAWRFLVEGRSQTLLIIAGVTIGVAAYVFITATMVGVQASMIEDTLGTQAHLSVLEEPAAPAPQLAGDGAIARTVQPPEPRQTPFDQWQRTAERVRATPGIRAVCPLLTGAALAVRGGGQQAVQIIGAEPADLAAVVDIPSNIQEGSWSPGADQAAIGADLAAELGLRPGSTLLLQAGNRQATVRVAGTFAMGSAAVDEQWVVLNLRGAQILLDRPGDITRIDATVDEVFAAEQVARAVAARTGRPVESWIVRNGALLSALSAQDQSTQLIRVFTLLAVAMGIASVLAVTVVQRRGQIGILRAMGIRASVVLQIFLWQGALLGTLGAALGTGLGALTGAALATVVPFPIVVDAPAAATATLISVGTGLLSALWPARSAARMDPAAAIRGDG
jgi:lipoprotein-releasing system permease protein